MVDVKNKIVILPKRIAHSRALPPPQTLPESLLRVLHGYLRQVPRMVHNSFAPNLVSALYNIADTFITKHATKQSVTISHFQPTSSPSPATSSPAPVSFPSQRLKSQSLLLMIWLNIISLGCVMGRLLSMMRFYWILLAKSQQSPPIFPSPRAVPPPIPIRTIPKHLQLRHQMQFILHLPHLLLQQLSQVGARENHPLWAKILQIYPHWTQIPHNSTLITTTSPKPTPPPSSSLPKTITSSITS